MSSKKETSQEKLEKITSLLTSTSSDELTDTPLWQSIESKTYTVSSIIKVASMALHGLYENYGHCKMSENNIYCGLFDVIEVLESAVKILPINEVSELERVEMYLKD